jgi:hypothetical protein
LLSTNFSSFTTPAVLVRELEANQLSIAALVGVSESLGDHARALVADGTIDRARGRFYYEGSGGPEQLMINVVLQHGASGRSVADIEDLFIKYANRGPEVIQEWIR